MSADTMVIVGCIMASYLLGAVPFGYLVARGAKGIDIRNHGSGNIGATNVGRVAGRPYGVLVFLLDGVKGFAPAFMGATLARGCPCSVGANFSHCMPIFCGAAAIVGHIWPIYLRFKGGKGVATALGVFLALALIPALVAFGVWLLVLAATRYVSVASMLAAVALPVSFVLLEGISPDSKLWTAVLCGLAGILVIVKHRSNVVRLMKGTEPRVGVTKGRMNAYEIPRTKNQEPNKFK